MTDVHSKGKVFVFYDLETTGFNHRTQHKEIEMVSIAAQADTGEVFTRHALPTVPMQPGASRVNGFTVVNSVLMFNGNPVSDVTSQAEALVGFTAFLDEVSAEKTLVLVAHNGHKFDHVVLANLLAKYRVDSEGVIDLVLDTVPLAMRVLGRRDVRQETLVRLLLNRAPGRKEGRHDAVKDVTDLKEIFAKVKERASEDRLQGDIRHFAKFMEEAAQRMRVEEAVRAAEGDGRPTSLIE